VRPSLGSRPSTPSEGNMPWQSKRASMLSNASSMSEMEEDGGYEGDMGQRSRREGSGHAESA
jgi:hypothetical protein